MPWGNFDRNTKVVLLVIVRKLPLLAGLAWDRAILHLNGRFDLSGGMLSQLQRTSATRHVQSQHERPLADLHVSRREGLV